MQQAWVTVVYLQVQYAMLAMNILGTAATIFTTKADLQAAVQAYDAN